MAIIVMEIDKKFGKFSKANEYNLSFEINKICLSGMLNLKIK